jgi:hypothetical protein
MANSIWKPISVSLFFYQTSLLPFSLSIAEHDDSAFFFLGSQQPYIQCPASRAYLAERILTARKTKRRNAFTLQH